MIKEGLNPIYEGSKIRIVQGFKPTFSFYKPKGSMHIQVDKGKVRDITYTPDFTIELPEYRIYIEAKGYTNDIYPYKEKLFRKWLEETPQDKTPIFFRLHTVTQLKEAINIINKL